MSNLRRVTVLVLVTVAFGLGATATAQAAFNDKTSVAAKVGTATIAAPAAVSAQNTSCNQGRTQTVLVSWQPSTSARISGYRITGTDNAGRAVTSVQVGSTTSSYTDSVDKQSSSVSSITYTVTTLTAYNWTAESLKSGVVTC